MICVGKYWELYGKHIYLLGINQYVAKILSDPVEPYDQYDSEAFAVDMHDTHYEYSHEMIYFCMGVIFPEAMS